MKENCIGHERALLLKTCSQMKLSENTELKISEIIKNIYQKEKSSEAMDNKAKELRLMIETCKSEQEVLENLK